MIDRYYIGETIDIVKRIEEHNEGFYGKAFTSRASDWELYLTIDCPTRLLARKMELHIKKMKSKKYIQDLKKYPEIILKLKERL